MVEDNRVVVSAIRFLIDRHDETMHPVATTGSNGFLMMAITVSRDEELAIGELSRRSGVNIETIRYYERRGLVPQRRRRNDVVRIPSER